MKIVLGLLAFVFLLFAAFGAMMCLMAGESLVVGGMAAKMQWFGAVALWVGMPLLGAVACLIRLLSSKKTG